MYKYAYTFIIQLHFMKRERVCRDTKHINDGGSRKSHLLQLS